jgi:hypothetical protein
MLKRKLADLAVSLVALAAAAVLGLLTVGHR